MAVTIPNDIIQASGSTEQPVVASDLLLPLKSLLTGVGVLPKDADLEGNNSSWVFTGTPPSVAILESGATAMSRGWTVLVGALGGTTAIGGATSNFWKNDLTGASRVVAVAGMALVVVGAIAAIAYMVIGDIKGRTTGAVALYAARQAIALRFIDESFKASQSTTAQTLPTSEAAAAPAPLSPSDLAIIALAAAQKDAAVIVQGNFPGKLSGLTSTDGVFKVDVTRDSDGTSAWYAPSDLRLQDLDYTRATSAPNPSPPPPSTSTDDSTPRPTTDKGASA